MRLHIYEERTGYLYLANGHVIEVDPNQFCSELEAQKVLTEWAQRLQIIGDNEEISTLS